MYVPSHPGCDDLGAASRQWVPQKAFFLWLSTDQGAHLGAWVTRNSGYSSHSVSVQTRWQLLDHELLERSAAPGTSWRKAWHLEDIQNVGGMSPESVTHAEDHNVIEYSGEYEMAQEELPFKK